MAKKHFSDKNADYFWKWQDRQRSRGHMPDFCVKTLDRVRKNAQKIDRQIEGSKGYNETLVRLRADKDKFYRQLKSSRKVSPPPKANCSHYTLFSWMESQHGNRENYIRMQYPYDLDGFMLMALRLFGADITEDGPDFGQYSQDTILRIIVIDEEYYAWLENTFRDDTEENRLKYMETVSDEDADRLLKKNHLNATYTVCVMPFLILYENGVPPLTRWEMSEDTKNVILSCLTRVFGEGNVYLPGIYGKADDLYNRKDRTLQQAVNYFTHGLREYQYRDCNQKHKGYATVATAGIPFVVRYVHPSASAFFGDILGAKGYKREEAGKFPDLIRFLDMEDTLDAQEAESDLPEVSLINDGVSAAIISDIERAGVHVLDCGGWMDINDLPDEIELLQAEVEEMKKHY